MVIESLKEIGTRLVACPILSAHLLPLHNSMNNSVSVFAFMFMFCQIQVFAEGEHMDDQLTGGSNVAFIPYKTGVFGKSIEKLSCEAKAIVLSQVVDVIILPDKLFLQDKKKYLQGEIGLVLNDLNSYREGFYLGWAYRIEIIGENDFAHCIENNDLPDIAGHHVSIGISEEDYMQKQGSSHPSSGLFYGYIDGRDFASFSLLERAMQRTHKKALAKKRESNQDLSQEERKQIIHDTPEYEAILFLKEVIKSKKSMDMKNIKHNKDSDNDGVPTK